MEGLKGVGEVLGILLAAAVVAAVALLRDWLKARAQPWLEGLAARHSVLTEHTVAMDRRILDTLVELRVVTSAERVYVQQFHNGAYFSARNPVWKMSRTHEVCRPGISYHARSLQAIPISILIEHLAGLWEEAGATLPACAVRLPCACTGKCGRGVWSYTVSVMPEGSVREMLREQGVRWVLLTPLLRGAEVVGLLGVDYCDETPVLEAALGEQICQAAAQVGYLLTNKRR